MVSRSRLDRYTSVVFVIMGGMLLIHFAIVNIPERQLIFDEYHYVPQARALLSGAQIPIWHPPLGVYLIAFSMAMFGDQEVGWRFFPIVFGVLSIWILYLLACRSTKNRATALLSSTLYALDSLAFVQSSIAMLDIFFVFFMLLGFLLYWRNNRTLACVSMGLSTLCKLVGGAGFIVLVVMMLLDHEKPTLLLKRTAAYALSVALTLWVLLLMQGMQIDPLSALLGMTRGNLFWTPHVTSTFASQPWDWLITPTPIPYYSANIPRRYRVVYRGIGNPMIWLLTVPAVLGLACDYVRHREKSSLFFLLW
nr:glycosyltransferase family 39 protein [Candidatus Njordarchaeum guaymaensis]